MPTKAVILAAGYGVRMKPLSEILPKPLMPVLGKPVLQHIVEKISRCGVTDIGINCHHHFQMIDRFCSSFGQNIHFRVSVEENIQGVGGGIGRFRDFIQNREDGFILHNGDILSNIDLEPVVAFFKDTAPLCVMVLHDCPGVNNVGVDGTRVADIRNTLRPGCHLKQLAYTGISIFSPEIFDHIPVDTPCDLIPVLLNRIRYRKDCVRAFVTTDCVWKDIGTVKNYFTAHSDILIEKKPLIDKKLIPESGLFCHTGCRMEENVSIKGFLSAGRNTRLKRFSSVENAVLWDGATVETGQHIQNAIVTGNGQVIGVD